MTITEKTAYLKGLLEGMNIDETKAEGKLLKAVIETLDELANDLTDVAEDVATLNDYVEELDEDLGDVEEYLYSDDDECDCDCCDCDDDEFECDGDCDCCDEDCDGFYEVECPKCGANVCFDETCDPRDLICPACQERFDCLEGADEE
ncbi:MAG: hypothetical protein IKU61_06425 [Clostridia bacterium]|nr:hypothetical protein [Clostridia bacterium]